MATLLSVDLATVQEIRQSVKDCTDRGLLAAAKWSSDLLLSIPADRRSAQGTRGLPPTSTSAHASSSSSLVHEQSQEFTQATQPIEAMRHKDAVQLTKVPESILAQERELEAQEEDSIRLGQSLMHAKEYHRVAPYLQNVRSSKGRFLSIYSTFLSSEQLAKRYWHRLDCTRRQPLLPVNASLPRLLSQVQNDTDPWLLFLKGLFLSRLNRRDEAIECVLLSIAAYAWNWSAWILLGSCISDGEELHAIMQLLPFAPSHPLMKAFQIKTLNELHCPTDSELTLCDSLLRSNFFPDSVWIMCLRASVLYHLHDFPQAEAQFDKAFAVDPHRVEDVDTFANILYVTDNKLKLSRLAHEFLALDPDRPEVCSVVGNHYSLRGDHVNAIKYFRRATQLDQTYMPGWTLMGHEYVEMKNSHAAIESYRRAIEVNRKDYRAWYGLGQAYELLNMHNYSLYYYQRATTLRPYDIRLWQAQAMCYEEMGRLRNAIECLKRALIPADSHEITITLRLAKIHKELGEYAESAAYHRRVVEVCEADSRPVPNYAKSCLEVAEYNMRIREGDLFLAEEYLVRVATSNAEDVMRAAEMLKAVRNKIEKREVDERIKRTKTETQAVLD